MSFFGPADISFAAGCTVAVAVVAAATLSRCQRRTVERSDDASAMCLACLDLGTAANSRDCDMVLSGPLYQFGCVLIIKVIAFSGLLK